MAKLIALVDGSLYLQSVRDHPALAARHPCIRRHIIGSTTSGMIRSCKVSIVLTRKMRETRS